MCVLLERMVQLLVLPISSHTACRNSFSSQRFFYISYPWGVSLSVRRILPPKIISLVLDSLVFTPLFFLAVLLSLQRPPLLLLLTLRPRAGTLPPIFFCSFDLCYRSLSTWCRVVTTSCSFYIFLFSVTWGVRYTSRCDILFAGGTRRSACMWAAIA